MQYRKTDAPDSDIIELKLSLGQIKLLESLVGIELSDVEHGYTNTCEKTLQTLSDVFWKHTRIKLTDEEEAAARKPWLDANRAANEEFKESMNASRGGLEHE